MFSGGRRARRAVVGDGPAHAAKVARVARELRDHDRSRPVSLRKRAAPHQVPKAGDLRRRDDKIDISDLDAILEIDPVARTCTAEPGVTFEDLVAATMRFRPRGEAVWFRSPLIFAA